MPPRALPWAILPAPIYRGKRVIGVSFPDPRALPWAISPAPIYRGKRIIWVLLSDIRGQDALDTAVETAALRRAHSPAPLPNNPKGKGDP